MRKPVCGHDSGNITTGGEVLAAVCEPRLRGVRGVVAGCQGKVGWSSSGVEKQRALSRGVG